MKLYHSAQSRSVRPRWLLEELGVPYDLVRLDLQANEHKRPEYLKINPNGTVPALVDGDLALFESGAMCQYLADKFPEKKLAPPTVTIFFHTVRKPEAERIPTLVTEARGQLAAVLGVIERALAGRPFILGADFSAADVMLGSTLGWASMLGIVGQEQPNVAAYVARLGARPAFQRASAD
jgi:glutathione S-transferase